MAETGTDFVRCRFHLTCGFATWTGNIEFSISLPPKALLRKIVAYIGNENPNAAETLVRELLDEAMRLESLPGDLSGVCGRRNLRQI